MLPKNLISLQHPFVKHLVLLRKERSFRREEKKVLVVGEKMVKELSTTHFPLLAILLQEGHDLPLQTSAQVITVTAEILKKITGVINPEPLAALVEMPPFQNLENSPYLLVLDGIADPGNLGTLIRSALALGWSGVYITENSCDPFNEKALRAAKGATFRMPLQEGSWEDLLKLIKHRQVFVADIEGSPPPKEPPKSPIALILSKESTGPRKETSQKPFQKITIPMSGLMESLNVSGAGAILLERLNPRLF